MPWTQAQQDNMSQSLNAIMKEYHDAHAAWTSSVATASLNPGLQADVATQKGRLDAALLNWRAFVDNARSTSESAAANGSSLDELSRLASQVADEKEALRRLRSEHGTRSEQIKPKIAPSPYINILGLRRSFRHNTKVGLIVASVLFGTLALGSMGYLLYSIVSSGTPMNPSLQEGGAKRRVRFADSV